MGLKIRQVLPGPLEMFSASPFSCMYRNAVLMGLVLAVDGRPPRDSWYWMTALSISRLLIVFPENSSKISFLAILGLRRTPSYL